MIERSVTVGIPPDAAFRVWTERVHLWWPPSHHMSGDPTGVIAFEPAAGGRFYERTSDGREFDYGRVLAWQPGALLRYAFFPGSGPEHPTEVEVRFTPTEAGTRVDVEHRAGRMAPESFERTAVRFRTSWEITSRAFATHIEESP